MWAYVKNLVSKKKETIATDTLFVIENKKEGWTRQKFSHTSLDQVDHEKEKYGKEEGSRMVRVLILQIADSKDQLENKITLVRPKEPTRLSLTEVAIGLTAFQKTEEEEAVKVKEKTKNKVNKTDSKKEEAQTEARKKEEGKTDTKKKDKVKTDTMKERVKNSKEDSKKKTKEDSKKKTKEDSKKKTKEDSKKKRKEDSEQEQEAGEREKKNEEEQANNEKEKEANNEMEQEENIDEENQFIVTDEEILQDEEGKEDNKGANGSSHDDGEGVGTSIEELKKQLHALKSKYQSAEAEILLLKTENKMLKGQNKTLAKISKEIKKLPGQMVHTSGRGGDLSKVKSVKKEEEFHNLEWNEETHIYVGCGQIIARSVFEEIDDRFTSFNTRALHAINAILGEDLSLYSKSGSGKDEGALKKLPESSILALKKILKAMSWATPSDFTEKRFKAFLNKQPHEERRKKTRVHQSKKMGKKTTSGKRKRESSSSSNSDSSSSRINKSKSDSSSSDSD